jgi:hypothetical protein
MTAREQRRVVVHSDGDCSHKNGNARHKRSHDGVGPVAGAASIRVGSVLSAVTEAALAGHRSLRLFVRTSEIMRWGLVGSAHGGLPPPIYSRAEHKRSHVSARENAFYRSIPRRPRMGAMPHSPVVLRSEMVLLGPAHATGPAVLNRGHKAPRQHQCAGDARSSKTWELQLQWGESGFWHRRQFCRCEI